MVDIHRDETDRSAPQAATYRLLAGDPVKTSHHGTHVTLKVDDEVTLPVPPPPIVDRVTQPFGRAPERGA